MDSPTAVYTSLHVVACNGLALITLLRVMFTGWLQ